MGNETIKIGANEGIFPSARVFALQTSNNTCQRFLTAIVGFSRQTKLFLFANQNGHENAGSQFLRYRRNWEEI
jgi:hypothetical protein